MGDMTVDEYNVKCGLLRTACPLIEPHVLLFDTGWELLGYTHESSETAIVHVKHKSFSEAEQSYRNAYGRLLMSGMIKPVNVVRSEPDAKSEGSKGQ